MDLQLAGKTAIVTGGASNIGYGISLALAREGANIVIADIDQPQAEHTADLAREMGVNAIAVRTDVTDQADCKETADRALAELGRIDVLVNNAGIGESAHGYFRDYDVDDAHRAMELNYWGTFYFSKAVIEPMIAQGSGSIVNISSRAYAAPKAHLPVYASAKAAVVALTQSLALELGPHGIRVNAVAPGLVLPAAADQVGHASSKFQPRSGRGLDDNERTATWGPQGALGDPDDIGRIVSFLASDAARFITGKTLIADGGARYGDEDERIAATKQVWVTNSSESA